MASLPNTVTTNEVNAALDQEFVANFRQEYDILAEILGIFNPTVMRAGQVLEQVKITGSLNNSKTTAGVIKSGSDITGFNSGSSSGSDYVEGDEVALSKYTVTKEPVGSISIEPYRKRTTAKAIAKNGYKVAVIDTDKKMLANTRSSIVKRFFNFLGTGTGEVPENRVATSLQGALALVGATLDSKMEANGDEGGSKVHFLNTFDAAEYLGKASITTQTVFGMTYIKNFLGVENVFLTNNVTEGEVIVTPVENIHVFGLDFGSLSNAGLTYETDASGLIGVAHTPAYDHVSVDTNVINGLLLFPEIKDYIVSGTITPSA